MKKFIVTVHNSKENKLITLELFLNSLGDVEKRISEIFDGWAQITAVIITQQHNEKPNKKFRKNPRAEK